MRPIPTIYRVIAMCVMITAGIAFTLAFWKTQQLREERMSWEERVQALEGEATRLRQQERAQPTARTYAVELAALRETRVEAPAGSLVTLLAAVRNPRTVTLSAGERLVWRADAIVESPSGRTAVTLPAEYLPEGAYRLEVFSKGEDEKRPTATYAIEYHRPR